MGASIRNLWATGFIAASTFAFAVTGCGDDDDDGNGNVSGTGGGGRGGNAGSSTGGNRAGSSMGGSTAGKPAGGSSGNAGTAGSNAGTAGSNAGSGGDAGGEGGGNPGGSGGDAGAGGDMGLGGAGGSGGEAGSAGSGGEGGADACAEYCSLVQTGCAADADKQYPDTDQCLQSCAAFPVTGVGNNSLACRQGEADLIATNVSHCDAAGPAGVGVCGTPCEAYCNLMVEYCPQEAEGASVQACLAECATVPGNDITTFVYPAAGGDTLSCRIAHATNAAKDMDPNGSSRLNHCNHASGDQAPCLDTTP